MKQILAKRDPRLRRSYLVPELPGERKDRGYDTLKYDVIVQHLQAQGWRRQETPMLFVNATDVIVSPDQRAEWWNYGPQVIIVAVVGDNSCILLRPTTARQAVTSTERRAKAAVLQDKTRRPV